MTTPLTRERLLAMPRRRVEVEVPGGVVVLQAPTAGEWLDYQRFVAGLDAEALEHITRIVALTAVDAEGKPLLTDEDCQALPHDVLTTLARAAFALTRTTEGSLEVAKGESSPSR